MKTTLLLLLVLTSNYTFSQEQELKSIIKNDNVSLLQDFLKNHTINECYEINNSNYNIMALAIKYNAISVFEAVLKDDKIDLESTCSGKRALMYAAKYGNTSIVEQLINAGAKMDVKSKKGRTAMDYAIKYEHNSIIELLKNFKR